MSKEEENKAVVGRWFTHFWGEICDLGIVDELAAPDMLLHYSLHASTVPQKLRSGNALRKSVMNALMSSAAAPRRVMPGIASWNGPNGGTAPLVELG